jgi:hypothetical protein
MIYTYGMYERQLDMRILVQKKIPLSLWPRSTGKTTLLRTQFPERPIINLLNEFDLPSIG